MYAAIFWICANLITVTITAKHDIYSGYSVHGVELRGQSDQIVLYSLQTDLNVDLWDHGAPGVRDARIMVSPENRVKVFDILHANDMKHYVHLADVAKALEDYEATVSRWKHTRQKLVPFEVYPTYAEVDAYMERIAREYPHLVTLVNSGNSFEGRPIKYLKISTTNFTNSSKPIYFMDATMHAREWVTTPVAIYTIHRLVEDLREEDRDLLENIDWIVMPIVNPDGYEYSFSHDRLWRRTRSFNATRHETCYGVDPNRNFDINFNTEGVSDDPCYYIFPGHEPFSEPETRYVRDIILEYMERMQIYMNIHSFGNYVLFGFGNATLPPNAIQVHHVASAMGAAMDTIMVAPATFYLVGNINKLMYATSGSAQDYAQTFVPFAYTLELPGYGFEFLVPPEYIEQMNIETWRGIAVTARLSNLYYRRRILN